MQNIQEIFDPRPIEEGNVFSQPKDPKNLGDIPISSFSCLDTFVEIIDDQNHLTAQKYYPQA